MLKQFSCFKLFNFTLGLLQANGITPLMLPAAHPQQNNKRKSRDGNTEDVDSTDEEEIHGRVKELKAAFPKIAAKLNALQDELEQLESRRAKKVKVKVEKREYSSRLNDVIDLT